MKNTKIQHLYKLSTLLYNRSFLTSVTSGVVGTKTLSRVKDEMCKKFTSLTSKCAVGGLCAEECCGVYMGEQKRGGDRTSKGEETHDCWAWQNKV